MKQKVLIIEGPDRCGKTTIGCELKKHLNIPYFKNSDEHKYFLSDPSYFKNAVKYVDTYFASYLKQSNASVILDRSYPSEWVYSRVFNRSTYDDVLNELDESHSKLGTKIIITYKNNYDDTNDQYQSINENILKIHNQYIEFSKWTKCDHLLLNVDDKNCEIQINKIKAFLGE